jgi:acyl-[acyl-carrier-protein]-phospholipid O-acyltransferase/long-chain-fatty-acid--[acyl-carrier-protein] ligase
MIKALRRRGVTWSVCGATVAPIRSGKALKVARAFDPKLGRRALFDALIDAAQTHGLNKPILEDQDRKPLSYRDLIRASFALGRKIAARTRPGERVALLLPSSAGAAVTFFALQAIGRTPAMLNFTAGARNLKAALTVAQARLILTSRRFIAQARLEDLVAELQTVGEIVYLEDVRESIGLPDRLYALAAGAAPRLFRKATKPDDIGVILFTSGSFAAPRGVALTQANIVSNALQVAAVIDIDPKWTLFNPLPVFHSLGLTGGVLLPLLCGVKAFQYPSPLHTKMVVDLIRESKADVLLSTDTFMGQYARAAAPGDLSGLTLAVCGAEKVRDGTRALMAEKFGPVQLLEGYGATEASPVIAVNPPHDNRPGTVGQLMPGLETRLEPVDGIPEGGRLFVRGPNVMAGYIDAAGVLEAPPDAWHDTGDIAVLESDGFVRLLGRAKRFAKIGGEMISLSASEDLAADLWSEGWRAVVAVSDHRKGERLVLVTDTPHANIADLLAHAQAQHAPDLAVPRKVVRVGAPVLLGTGKTDYAAVQRIAEAEG